MTRAREQASGLRDRLETLGAQVLELPTIAIEPLEVPAPDLTGVEWLLLTSPNGVDGFFTRGLRAHGLDARALAGVRDSGRARAHLWRHASWIVHVHRVSRLFLVPFRVLLYAQHSHQAIGAQIAILARHFAKKKPTLAPDRKSVV